MKTRGRSRSDSDLYSLQSSASRSGGRGGSRRTFPQPVFDEPPMKELDTSGRCSEFLDIPLWCDSCRDASLCDGRRQSAACERPLDDPDHPKHANQNDYVEGHRRVYERKLRSASFAIGDPDIGRRGSGSSATRMDEATSSVTASAGQRRSSSAISAGSNLSDDDGVTSPRPASRMRRDTDLDVTGGGGSNGHGVPSGADADTSLQSISVLSFAPVDRNAAGSAGDEGDVDEEMADIDARRAQSGASDTSVASSRSAASSRSSVYSTSPSPYDSDASPVCIGVRCGTNRGLLGFIGNMCLETGRLLRDIHHGEKDLTDYPEYAMSSDLLLPMSKIQVSRRHGGDFELTAVDCTGKPRESKSKQAKSRRCNPCHKANNRTKDRAATPKPTPRVSPKPQTNVGIISKDATLANAEIIRLRKALKEKEEVAVRKYLETMSDKDTHAVKDTNHLDALRQLYSECSAAIEKDEGECSRQMLMKMAAERLKVINERDGNSRGVPIHPAMVNYAIRYLKKHGRGAYQNSLQQLGFGHISTVDRKAADIGSRVEDKAAGVHVKTIQAFSERLDSMGYREEGCAQRNVALPCDAYEVRSGIFYNLHTNRFEGIDEDEACPYNVLESKFNALAREATGNSTPEDAPILENISLSRYHLVVKMVSTYPGLDDFDDVIGAGNFATLRPGTIAGLYNRCFACLQINRLNAVTTAADAAGENIQFYEAIADEYASSYIPDDIKNSPKYSSINFRQKVIRTDPSGKSITALLSDMPHLVKCLRGGVVRSDPNSKSKSEWRHGEEHICMKKLYEVWKLTGGGSNQIRPTKLSEGHFYPDQFTAMRVSLATQIFSKSTVAMIEAACDDPSLPNITEEYYAKTTELCSAVNDLTDICNGRASDKASYNASYTNTKGDTVTGKYSALFDKSNGRAVQEKLLDILVWFTDWEADNKKKIGEGKASKHNFIPRQTFKNLNRLILGLVAIIQFYSIDRGQTLVPRKMNTDPCEHHFSVSRGTGGSTGGINCMQADLADSNQISARNAARAVGSNNQFAPKVSF